MVGDRTLTERLRIGLLVLSAAVLSTAASAAVVSRTFSFDTPTDLEPGGFWAGRFSHPAGGEVSWDPTTGNAEPGSLRLEGVGGVSSVVQARSPCLPIAGSSWQLQATGRRVEGICNMGFRVFRQPDCSDDDVAGTGVEFGSPDEDAWLPGPTVVLPSVAGETYSHLQVVLAVRGAVSDTSPVCWYDDVVLSGPLTQAIPDFSAAGRALLLFLLALSGALLLRGRL